MATVKFPTFPNVDFSKLDLNALRNIDLPSIDLPSVDTAAVTAAAKDIAYITVGLGVLAFQKVQTRRREFTKSIEDQIKQVRDLISV